MKYFTVGLGIFLALAISRFVPHPPNFTSLLALSFYVPALLGIRYLPILIFSFLIEFLQSLTTYRSFELEDIFFNFLGIFVCYFVKIK